jgi:hypothetical protein
MPFDLDERVDLSRAQEIVIGSQKLTVAPLTLRQTIKATTMLPKMRAAEGVDQSLEFLVDFVMLGLARTYPTLTRDELLDSEMTPDQLREAADIVMVQGGGKKVDPSGEDQAASDLKTSTGESSSPISVST